MKLKLFLAAIALCASAPANADVARTAQNIRCSATITTGGTSQIAVDGDNARGWLIVQNPTTATEPLFVDFGPNHLASTTLSAGLAPGGPISFLGGVVPAQQVNVTAATTGHAFICVTGR